MNLVVSEFPSAALATLPALDLEVSLSPPGQGPVWRSIAGDVRAVSGFSTRRGRSDELARSSPGSFQCVLANRERTYDPDHEDSPLYGHIKPMRRVRFLARYSSVTCIVYDGFVDQWQQEYPYLGKDVVASLSATDGFKILARSRLPFSPYAEAVRSHSANVYYQFNDPTVLANSATSTVADGTWAATPDFTTGAIAADSGAAVTLNSNTKYGAGTHTVTMSSPAWAMEFWFKTTLGTAGYYPIVAWKNNSVCGAIIYDGTGHRLWYQTGAGGGGSVTSHRNNTELNDGEWHHCVLRDTGTPEWIIDGTNESVSTGSGVFTVNTIADGELRIGWDFGTFDDTNVSEWSATDTAELDDLALYSSLSVANAQAHNTAGTTPWSGDTSGARVARILNSAGWPASLRDLDTGDTTLQAVANYEGEYALDLLQTLWDTERGQLYMGLDSVMSANHEFQLIWRERSALTDTARPTVAQAIFNDGGAVALELDGTSGAFAWAPDSVGVSLTGDLAAWAEVSAAWIPTGDSTFIAKWNSSGDQRSFWFGYNNTGLLKYEWSPDGTNGAVTTKVSSVASGFFDDSRRFVGVTHDVDNGAAGNDIKFWTSTDGETWTQLGSTQTTAGTTSIFDSTARLTVGAYENTGTGRRIDGRIFQAALLSGASLTSGTDVASPNFTEQGTPAATVGASTYTDTQSNLWTIAGTAAIIAGLPYAGITTDPSGETFLYNDIEITRRGGQPQHVNDAASIEEYLTRTLSVSGLEFSADSGALTLADALLAKYKDPHTRITALVIKPQSSPTLLWPQVLGREIGDRITVSIRPNATGTPIRRDLLIVGVDHTLANAEWVTTWRLSEVDLL
jgi:hypothetical protein